MQKTKENNINHYVSGFGSGMILTAVVKPIMAGIYIHNTLPNGDAYLLENYEIMIGVNLGQLILGLLYCVKLPLMNANLAQIWTGDSSDKSPNKLHPTVKATIGFMAGAVMGLVT